MQEWQERLVVEHTELRTKLFVLQNWLKSDHSDLSVATLFLLKEQAEVMIRYERILAARISMFGQELKS